MRLDHDEMYCPAESAELAAVQAAQVVVAPQRHFVEDDANDGAWEMTRKIVASGIQNDAFLLANEDQLVANCTKWAKEFPMIQPYFDVSFNLCPWVLETLDHFNIKFSCQSKAEIEHILAQGIEPQKILFSTSTLVASHIKQANKKRVALMSFSTFNDLKKIQKSQCEDLGLLLALQPPTGNPETDRQWLDLLNAAKDLNVVGVKFVAGHKDLNKMMALTKMAFTIGLSLGLKMKIIDIGSLEEDLDDLVPTKHRHLQGVDCQIIGHLGVNFIENVFTSAAKIIGKSVGNNLVINDGIFSNFGRLMVDEDFEAEVKVLRDLPKDGMRPFDVYGSSGDDMDVIAQDCQLSQSLDENDWLHFSKMGAFSFGLQANMISAKLPAKFGNFRLFSPAPEESNFTEDGTLSLEDALISPDNDGLEIVFLDIQEDLEQRACLSLFEELPHLACQDTLIWPDEFCDH